MRISCSLLALIVGVCGFWPATATCRAAEDSSERLTVSLASGKRLKGYLDSRTDERLLWIWFGSERVRVARRFYWEEVREVRRGDEVLPRADILRLAGELAPAEPSPRTLSEISVGPADRLGEPVPTTPVPRVRERVASVQFDAALVNWDGDVEADGLVVQLWPIGEYGGEVPAEGVLHGELWAMRRLDQNSVPRSGGRKVERLASWAVPVRGGEEFRPIEVRLPFQQRHPEFDASWSSSGLLHLTFVVPGSGVFHQSLDALRIRPFAPLRDFLQREMGERFLPTEATGRTW